MVQKEITQPVGLQENPLTESEIDAINRIRWAFEGQHPDGGTQPQFGLLKISTPRDNYLEVINISDSGPKKVLVPPRPSVIGEMEGPEWKYSRLIYANLRRLDPVIVYLSDPTNITQPVSPERINEIGDFVVDVDKAIRQDNSSRIVLETQRNLLRTYEQYVTTGILDRDEEILRAVIEGASVHILLLEETRKKLPTMIRELSQKAKDMGVEYISERWHPYKELEFDPQSINEEYDPCTDGMPESEFNKFRLKYNRWHKARI